MNAYNACLKTIVAAALLAGSCGALAQENDEVGRLINPESTFRVGAGYLDVDNQRFGQYMGLRKDGLYGVLDLSFVERENDTGTWFIATGRNLGFEHREASVEARRQGHWGVVASYSELPRYNPYSLLTGLGGIGTDTLTINGAGTLREAQLSTLRQAFMLAADRRLAKDVTFQVNFRNEHKDGARQFGRGTPGAMEILAEPIDYTMQQLESSVVYAGRDLQLAGGYYATSFDNENPALNVVGGAAQLAGGASPFTPIALPPDNESHQLYLAAGYSFTPTARASFKAAYSRLKQEDDFIVASSIGRTDLGGRVDVSMLYMGLTAQPFSRLSLNSQLRYEDRSDKTPIARYFSGAGAASTFNGDNEPRSIRTTFGKVEASYALPLELRMTGGVAYEEKGRSVSPVRVVTARDETRELSYRAELRRTLTGTLSGALSCVRSDRDGSPLLTTVLNNGAPGSNLVAPLHLADRERDKVRVMLDWAPLEQLSVQLQADYADDDYSGRSLGIEAGRAEFYSLDISYVLSANLQATVWGSRGETRAGQRTQTSAPTGQFWSADLRNHDDAYGLEIRGRPWARLELGAGLQHFDYRDEYRMAAISGAPMTSLPDITNRQSKLELFASYELGATAGVRVDIVHDRWRTNDWTWTSWVYSDGSRAFQDPNQRVNFIAVSGYLKTW